MEKSSMEKRVQETIRAEIVAVNALKNLVDDNFSRVLKLITVRKGKIIVTGVGKSGFIAMKMVATLVSLGHDAVFLSPLDALHGDSGMVKDGDVVIAFSFSGASPELVRLVKHFREHFTIKVVAITGNRTSPLAKISNGVLSFTVTEEGCPLGLAPMASTTASLVIADCIAAALTSPLVFKEEHFAKFHPAGSLGLSLKKVKEIMRAGKKLPKVSHDASFEDALKVIMRQKISQIVAVVDENEALLGVFGDGDMRRKLLTHGDLRGKNIVELMNKNPKTITGEESLQIALEIMKDFKINNLFVTDEDHKCIGFIHMHDIIGE